jgi:polygalacturonase
VDGKVAKKAQVDLSRRAFLRGGVALGGALGATMARSSLAGAVTRFAPPKWLRDAHAVARSISVPTFPGRTRHLTPVEENCRQTIQDAINEMNAKGGGTISLAKGQWRIHGPLRLASHINLHLERGAEVVFSGEPKNYLPTVVTRWEGTELLGFSPYIYAYNSVDVALTGEGTISVDMSGDVKNWRTQQTDSQKKLRAQGASGAPLAERVYGEGSFLRQSCIQFFGCHNVLVEGVRIKDIPFWGVHLVFSHQVTVRKVSVDSALVNNDGVDVDSSTHVLIEQCVFNTGDDSIAIKAGRDLDGRRAGAPSEAVVIRDCVMNHSRSSGIAIGSEMSGGVRDIYVIRCRMGQVDTIFNIKSNLDRGGVVERIRAWNIQCATCDRIVAISTSYHGYAGGNFPPTIQDIELDDLRSESAETGIVIRGVATSPVKQVRLSSIHGARVKIPTQVQYAKGLFLEGVVMNGIVVTSPDTADSLV